MGCFLYRGTGYDAARRRQHILQAQVVGVPKDVCD
jgi:hypothetical protein